MCQLPRSSRMRAHAVDEPGDREQADHDAERRQQQRQIGRHLGMRLDPAPEASEQRFALERGFLHHVLEVEERRDQQSQHEGRGVEGGQQFALADEAHQIDEIADGGEEDGGRDACRRAARAAWRCDRPAAGARTADRPQRQSRCSTRRRAQSRAARHPNRARPGTPPSGRRRRPSSGGRSVHPSMRRSRPRRQRCPERHSASSAES